MRVGRYCRRLPVMLALLFTPPALRAQAVTELYVTPDTLLLSAGERHGLTVQAFDDAGNIILAVRYRSADTLVARVEENGTVVGVGSGRTKLTVQAGRKTVTVVVVVAGPPAPAAPQATGSRVARLAVEPAAVSLLPTEREQVKVLAFGADSVPVPSPPLRWRSLRPDVVSVGDTTGVITGLATGTATVEVAVPGGPSAGVTVTVALAPIAFDRSFVALAPGGVDTIGASVPAQGNRPIRGDDLTWKITDPSIAEVSPAGVVRANALGRSEIVVGGFLQERRIPVVVHPPVAYFLVLPRVTDPARVPVGGSREFMVEPHAADSAAIPGVPILWSVGDTSIAVFDTATRRLTGVKVGQTTLTFAARGFLPRSWTVDVIAGTLGFERSRAVLRPGEEVTFRVGLVDSTGRIVGPAPEVRWSSSDPARATVSAEGTLVALAPGRVVVRAALPTGAMAEAVAFIVGEALVATNRSGQLGIYAVNFTGRDTLTPLVVDSGRNVEARYSPDRTRLAWSSDREDGQTFDIWVGDADGKNPVRLTTDPASEGQPAWTPDGKFIVYVSTKSGVRQLHVVAASGGTPRVLTSLPSGAADPVVSPDGSTVAFTTFPAGPGKPGDILTVPFAGGTPTPVTSTRERGERAPLYLADGQLAWVERPRDKAEPDLIASRTAGGTPVVLARSNNEITAASSSQDGRTLGWLVAQAGERDRKAVDYVLRLKTPGAGTERFIRFLPDERVASIGF